MITEIMIYVALGIVGDILVTLYYLFVGKLQAVPASFLTILITLLNFFIIERVVVSTNWMLMVFYAIGSAVGCFTIIGFQKARLKKKLEKQRKSSRKRK
jgi:uncharacterized membrane protein YeiH